jgi:hypothetical protein
VEQARQVIRIWAIRIAVIIIVLLSVLLLLYVISLLFDKSLWALLKVLSIPITVGAAVPLLNWLQKKRELDISEATEKARRDSELEIEDQRAQDEALQAYLDHMSQLVTDKERPLHKARPRDNWSTVARARTFTALGRLDSSRKRSVMQFLYESGLIYKEGLVYKEQIILDEGGLKEQIIVDEGGLVERQHNIVSLKQADLSGADLSGADLRGANLSRANLGGADLSYAALIVADLRGANLSEADLSGADLRGAGLFRANLRGANLRGADLTDANVSEQQLRSAASLEGATMPDGEVYSEDWPKWLKDKENHNGPPR